MSVVPDVCIFKFEFMAGSNLAPRHLAKWSLILQIKNFSPYIFSGLLI